MKNYYINYYKNIYIILKYFLILQLLSKTLYTDCKSSYHVKNS